MMGLRPGSGYARVDQHQRAVVKMPPPAANEHSNGSQPPVRQFNCLRRDGVPRDTLSLIVTVAPDAVAVGERPLGNPHAAALRDRVVRERVVHAAGDRDAAQRDRRLRARLLGADRDDRPAALDRGRAGPGAADLDADVDRDRPRVRARERS